MEERRKPISLPPVLDSDPIRGRFSHARKPGPDSRGSTGFIQPHRPEPAQTGLRCVIDEGLERMGAGIMLRKMARVIIYVHPEASKSTISFEANSILLGAKKIGDIRIEGEKVTARIWFHNLGYPIGSLPPEDFQRFFKFGPLHFEELSGSASYLVMMGVHSNNRSYIGLFFYDDFETRRQEYFPFRQE